MPDNENFNEKELRKYVLHLFDNNGPFYFRLAGKWHKNTKCPHGRFGGPLWFGEELPYAPEITFQLPITKIQVTKYGMFGKDGQLLLENHFHRPVTTKGGKFTVVLRNLTFEILPGCPVNLDDIAEWTKKRKYRSIDD